MSEKPLGRLLNVVGGRWIVCGLALLSLALLACLVGVLVRYVPLPFVFGNDSLSSGYYIVTVVIYARSVAFYFAVAGLISLIIGGLVHQAKRRSRMVVKK